MSRQSEKIAAKHIAQTESQRLASVYYGCSSAQLARASARYHRMLVRARNEVNRNQVNPDYWRDRLVVYTEGENWFMQAVDKAAVAEVGR